MTLRFHGSKKSLSITKISSETGSVVKNSAEQMKRLSTDGKPYVLANAFLLAITKFLAQKIFSRDSGFMPVAARCLRSESSSNPSYERRGPEKSLLYKTIQGNLARFLAQCEADNRPVPRFVQKEFEAYLRCGILAHGFARVYCSECRYDRLVAFSCKKRGFCGSCMARRMSETATHLVDSVIPKIPTRQWVLSVPAPLRFLIAYDAEALNAVLEAFTKTVFSCLKKRPKRVALLSNGQWRNQEPSRSSSVSALP